MIRPPFSSFSLIMSISLFFGAVACQAPSDPSGEQTTNLNEQTIEASKMTVILDTDANNELDDQHAIAYLLFNGHYFNVPGITVNRTNNGGPLENHMAEADRIVELCGLKGKIPIYKGADKNFNQIKDQVNQKKFDGSEAVNFIIEQVNAAKESPLILLPIGKLTNIALALAKAPSIASKIRIVWLGSNYPEPGEYNQDNDTASMNYILNLDVPFEMVTVRYSKSSGTTAIKVSPTEIKEKMAGLGPKIDAPVVGRHDNSFSNFGDYSVNLFDNAELYGDPPARSLFDVGAIAIVKDASWAEKKMIPAPILVDNRWQERPDNPRKIIVWENFDKSAILEDFFKSMKDYQLATTGIKN